MTFKEFVLLQEKAGSRCTKVTGQQSSTIG